MNNEQLLFVLQCRWVENTPRWRDSNQHSTRSLCINCSLPSEHTLKNTRLISHTPAYRCVGCTHTHTHTCSLSCISNVDSINARCHLQWQRQANALWDPAAYINAGNTLSPAAVWLPLRPPRSHLIALILITVVSFAHAARGRSHRGQNSGGFKSSACWSLSGAWTRRASSFLSPRRPGEAVQLGGFRSLRFSLSKCL